jgi:hypothetical protein
MAAVSAGGVNDGERELPPPPAIDEESHTSSSSDNSGRISANELSNIMSELNVA